MSFELTGKVIEKFDTQQVSDNFRKREFVVEKTEQGNTMEFVDYVKFQLTQDRCNILDNVNVNDQVKVHFNIRGRKWEKEGNVNYFTNLEAWRIEKESSDEYVDRPDSYEGIDVPPPTADDDLPF